jgi:putative polymerase
MTHSQNWPPQKNTEMRVKIQQARVGRFASAHSINWPALILIFSAVLFNYFLCFVNTNIAQVSRLDVIGLEIAIISITFLIALPSISRAVFILIVVIFLYLVVLTILQAAIGSGQIDVKVIRDFMIPIAFFLLGARVRDLRSADLIVRDITVIIIVAGLFEMLFLNTYLKYFNVINYYIVRGTVDPLYTQYLSNNLFVSGIRPEGRTLFGFLGDHRVSSVFLEPVSPGNFGTIVFVWALVRSRAENKLYIGLFLMAFLIIVMADNRLGAGLCILSLALTIVPLRYSYPVILILPFAFIGMLLEMHSLFPTLNTDDSTLGRLASSGQLLSSLNILNWMGFQEVPNAVDSGYSAVVTGIGILGFAVLWWLFMTVKRRNSDFNYFRVLSGLYISTNLCISYSVVTIKTAALLWFLAGVLAYAPNNRTRLVRVQPLP